MTTLSQTSTVPAILPVPARVRHTLRAFAHGVFWTLALGCVAGCDEVDGAEPECDTDEPECDSFRWANGRREFTEFECNGSYECFGRWEGTSVWSRVYFYYYDIDHLPQVDPATMWPCDPTPDVDICVVIDAQGHKGCFRNYLGWAVAVAPSCAVSGTSWVYVGNDMKSKIAYYGG